MKHILLAILFSFTATAADQKQKPPPTVNGQPKFCSRDSSKLKESQRKVLEERKARFCKAKKK